MIAQDAYELELMSYLLLYMHSTGLPSTYEQHPSTDPKPGGQQTLSPITRFAIFGAILTPIALVPYLLSKRQISVLRTTVEELKISRIADNLSRQKFEKALFDKMAARDAEVSWILKENTEAVQRYQKSEKALLDKRVVWEAQIKGAVTLMRTELATMRSECERRDKTAQTSVSRANQVSSELILLHKQQTQLHIENMRDLGRSLADAAAFMHEMELEFGLPTRDPDSRGVERLRLLAMKLQSNADGERATLKETEVSGWIG